MPSSVNGSSGEDTARVARPKPRVNKEARKAEDGKPFETARNIKVDQIRARQADWSSRQCGLLAITPPGHGG